MQEFHDHLNSVNSNIQLTKEVEQGNRLSFLDTTTTRVRDRIRVSVYRKPTHTDKYLDYNSLHPSQHKRTVVNTLLHRAQVIPSTNAERSKERRHVIKVLRDSNYALSFIRSCMSYHNSLRRDSTSTNVSSSASTSSTSLFVVLPYVRGVSERISRVLRNNGVKVSYRPFHVLRTCFPRPKDKPSALQCRGVNKVSCVDCNVVYYGQTDRPLETRLNEHKSSGWRRQFQNYAAREPIRL